MIEMAQKLRPPKEISPSKFDRLMSSVLKEDEELLDMLAKV